MNESKIMLKFFVPPGSGSNFQISFLSVTLLTCEEHGGMDF